jgi:hypothetical protein
MQKIQKAVQNKIAAKAINKMLRVVANAQKAAAPDPITKKSIGIRAGKSRKTGEEFAKAGINVGKSPQGRLNAKGKIRRGSVQQPVAHLLTMGTKPRYTGYTTRAKGQRGIRVSTGNVKRYTGMMRQHLFLKKASAAAFPGAIAVGRQTAWNEITKVL